MGSRAPATLGRCERLLLTRQFEETYAQNRRWHGRYMVLFLRSGADASRRLGVVASRKVGPAVARSRAKRRLREAFRRHRTQFTGRTDDVVLVARRSILTAPWELIVQDLLRLASQAGLLSPPG